jgi:hypothetical protein
MPIGADLKKNSKKVTSNDEITQVGTISANGDKSDWRNDFERDAEGDEARLEIPQVRPEINRTATKTACLWGGLLHPRGQVRQFPSEKIFSTRIYESKEPRANASTPVAPAEVLFLFSRGV